MKAITILLFSLIFSNLLAQEIVEKEIKTEVNEVTVFIDKAQVTRQKTVELNSGITILKFINLSPFIDAKSVQVKAKGDVTVLAVNHQQNFIDKLEKSEEVKKIEEKLDDLKGQIKLEETYLSILKEELTFLNDNRIIGGKNNELNISTLKEASEFYSSKLTALKLKEIERSKTLENLRKQKNELQSQLNTLTSKKEFASGEILVKVQSKIKTNPSFELSYIVDNAGWYPTYDIRAKTINDPVEIIYKANLRQDTKVDWKNVKLSFSSSNPNSSGVAPELKAYFLDYYSLPPVYNKSINSVGGQVVDEENQPLIGVTVMVPKTTIGTVTDMNGNYSITLPNNADYLNFSFVGCESQTLPITSSVINVKMIEDVAGLEEVVVVGYGVQGDAEVSTQLQGRVAGVSVNKTKSRDAESIAIPFEKTENQTSINFEISTPYTVNSDNKNYSVDMVVYQVPAFFQYYTVPKIEKEAYLIANITDWEKYNLLEGEANIFFEETFVGKSLLDVRFASDTLQLSLGKDKNVIVNREKEKDFETRQFIGSKKEESKSWKTTIKNNKSQEINMVVLDQAPVSKLEEIEVNIQDVSGGKLNKESGEVKWEFTLKPMEKKEFDLKYSVKYPKSRNLIIE
ncbi:mucoidy inhibitor MuiA family protein [Draconibacterium sediminis]|uniref:mucoidy inhibitor MuiA family protein n=1 Tax=Draconibacterium sediminis TaxID=1544798 RepID=UPI000696248C|nr:mucoidy inhibitor MuiA family protein [Draconibacterium sediminis]